MGHARERHVSAITSTHHRYAIRIQQRVTRDKIKERRNIAYRILTFKAIIQRQESFPVAIRPAHVREEQRDPEFVKIIIVPPLEDWPRLRLRPAMDDNDSRTLARKSL